MKKYFLVCFLILFARPATADFTFVGEVTLNVPPPFSSYVDLNFDGLSKTTFVPPFSFSVVRGLQVNGSLAAYIDSDDIVASYNPGFTINNTEAPVWLEFDGTAPSATEFLVESSAGTPGLEYTVEAFNWNTMNFDVVGTTNESFETDQVATFSIVAADHIDSNGAVQSRVGWRAVGFTINFPWEVRVDQVGWNQ